MELSDSGVVDTAAQHLRNAASARLTAAEIAVAVSRACERWRDRSFVPRRESVARIASAWSYSEALIDESLDALLAPFSSDALAAFARKCASGPKAECLHAPIGLIMAGNVIGGGLHEVVIALVSGAALLIKTASTEPVFFARFAETLSEIESRVGARLAVLNWSRERADLTAALKRNCSWITAFGDDETIASLGADAAARHHGQRAAVGRAGRNYELIGFGHRISAMLITHDGLAAAPPAELADAVARDVSLFEQHGCLSPHHVFVEQERNTHGQVREFAARLATSMEAFARRCPPPASIGLEDAAAVRRAREIARWRHLGGHEVELWEGNGLGWTVVCDGSASFRASPGYRTVNVSPYAGEGDLERRLEPVAPRLEALGVADPAGRLAGLMARLKTYGLSYVCIPGMMQSPPLEWRHGRGVFVDRLRGQP